MGIVDEVRHHHDGPDTGGELLVPIHKCQTVIPQFLRVILPADLPRVAERIVDGPVGDLGDESLGELQPFVDAYGGGGDDERTDHRVLERSGRIGEEFPPIPLDDVLGDRPELGQSDAQYALGAGHQLAGEVAEVGFRDAPEICVEFLSVHGSIPSISISFLFTPIPQENPPIPDDDTARWQGTTIGRLFLPHAVPTALQALGCPILSAISP